MNIVIFGPPGAGKGTQSNFIVKKFNLHQLSTGEILRKEIKNKTKITNGITIQPSASQERLHAAHVCAPQGLLRPRKT